MGGWVGGRVTWDFGDSSLCLNDFAAGEAVEEGVGEGGGGWVVGRRRSLFFFSFSFLGRRRVGGWLGFLHVLSKGGGEDTCFYQHLIHQAL